MFSKFTILSLVLLFSLNAFSFDINQKIRAIRKYGAFHIRVVKRIKASSAINDDLVPIDAKIKTVYRNGQQVSVSENVFTTQMYESMRLPVVAEMNQETFKLVSFEIDSRDGREVLLKFDASEIEKYKNRAINGVLVSVIYSKNHPNKPEIEITDNLYKVPSEYIPNETFKSITKMSPSVDQVLSFSDYKKMVESFRNISSATDKYHQELLELVNSKTRLTSKQLLAILDSVYFPLASKNNLFGKYKEIRLDMNVTAEETSRVLAESIALADHYSTYINQIVMAGIDKLTDLDPSFGKLILVRTYPVNPGLTLKESQEVFDKVLSKVGEKFNQDDKHAFLQIALDRSLFQESIALGIDWFKSSSDKNLYAYGALIERFHFSSDASDLFIAGSYADFASSLAKNSFFTFNEIKTIFKKCKKDECKTAVLIEGYKNVPKPSVALLVELIVDLTSSNAKDAVIDSTYDLFSDLDQKQAFMLVKTTSKDLLKKKILLQHFQSFKDVSVDQFSSMLSTIGSLSMRDDVALKFVPLLTEVSVKSLSNLLTNLSDDSVRFKVFDKLLVKPEGGIRAADTALLAGIFTTESIREKVLLKLISFAGSSATEELFDLTHITKNTVLLKKIIMAYLPNCYDLIPANYQLVVDQIDSVKLKDSVLLETVGRFKKLSTADSLSLINSASAADVRSKIAVMFTPTITDFRLESVLSIAGLIDEGKSRDVFLIKAVGWVVPLNKNGLFKIINLTKNKANKSVIYIKGFQRIPEEKK